MHPAPSVTWEADFDFYETRSNDARAILALDLGLSKVAPLDSHPHRLQIRVRMLRPRDDGLRASDEAPALFALEDRIVEQLTSEQAAVQVGRIIHDGHSMFVFYVGAEAAAHCDTTLATLVRDSAPYELEWFTEEDAAWSFYREVLWPDAYAHQSILNRRLMLAREEHQDCPEIVREVDHLAYFAYEEHAREAKLRLAAVGFRVDEPRKHEGGGERAWGMEFHRNERLDAGRPDEFVAEILDVILPLGGDYDGWGAVIESR